MLPPTTASSQAATVQITLTGNSVSTNGGNQLVADLTGDGVSNIVFDRVLIQTDVLVGVGVAFLTTNGRYARAGWYDGGFYNLADIGGAGGYGRGVGTSSSNGPSPGSVGYLNPVTFTDSRINGGAATNGYLQVNAFNTSSTNHTVELTRLIFDDASTTRPAFASIPGAQAEWGAVPEPSSLGLLALGAGGLLLRRSRAKAA